MQELHLWLPQSWVGRRTRLGGRRLARGLGRSLLRQGWLGLDITRPGRRGLRRGQEVLVLEGLEKGQGLWAFLEVVTAHIQVRQMKKKHIILLADSVKTVPI